MYVILCMAFAVICCRKVSCRLHRRLLSFEYRVLYSEPCVCLEKLVIPFSSAYQGLQVPLLGFVAPDAKTWLLVVVNSSRGLLEYFSTH